MRKTFGETIVRMAELDSRVVLMTGDVEQEMALYKERFPNRFFNLGLTEQTIVGMAGGMALFGLRPVVYSITPFLLERAFEFIKIDVDFNKLPVILIGYSDYPNHGPTHTCLDEERTISLFKNIMPYFPSTLEDVKSSMFDALSSDGPSFIFLRKYVG